MMGDSVSRDCYYVFNEFLESGKTYKVDGNYEALGEKGDYDDDETWTSWKRFGFVKEQHRIYFKKDFDDIGASSEFWFLQKAWSTSKTTGGKDSAEDIAGDVAKNDIALINSGWWDLKEDDDADRYCGKDFGKDDCEKDYLDDIEHLADEILTKVDVGLFRTTSCCGEDKDRWVDAIEDMNDAMKDLMADKGVGVVDIYDRYKYKNIDDYTTDGKHADPDECLEWFSIAFRMIDEAYGTNCFGDQVPPAPAPTYNCPDALRPAEAYECPEETDIANCADEALEDGDLCEGDGECSTDKDLNNCGDGADIYVLTADPAVPPAPTAAPVAPTASPTAAPTAMESDGAAHRASAFAAGLAAAAIALA